MARFTFDGEAAILHLTEDDKDVLRSLVEQFLELLGEVPAPAVVSDDPFALWEADLAEFPDEPEIPEDPALQRLFPNPYPHDAEAASEHRRFATDDARRRKIADAETVLAGTPVGALPVRVPVAEVGAWLKTLNALRLVIATRLGIDDADAMAELAEAPDDDPRLVGASLLDYLGDLQVILIELTTPAGAGE